MPIARVKSSAEDADESGMERRRAVRATRLLTAPVGVAFAALALATHVAADRHDGRTQAQRDYEAISHSTESPCTPDPEYGNPICGAPNSAKSDLSVTATASRTGNDITIKAVVRNHQWANATASGFSLGVERHPYPKPYLVVRDAKLDSGLSSERSHVECLYGGCKFLVPVAPGTEIGFEMTVHGTDAKELKLYLSTLDTIGGSYLELDEEDNRIIVPVETSLN